MRSLLLFAVVFGLAAYAWRDWFKALCGLIVLMAVTEHPDMPRSLLGVDGLNPWNLLCLDIVAAWAVTRRSEGRVWDLPRHVTILLLLYFGVILVSFLRMLGNPTGLPVSTAALWNEGLINSLKFVVPGVLLFDGCRSRSRFNLALLALLGLYLLLAVQVFKWVPFWWDPADLERRTRKILRAEVGYYRVDLSTMLAGASWALFAAAGLLGTPGRRLLAVGLGLLVVGAQLLTAGRGGYVAWVVVGLVLCCLRWRRYFLLTPIVVAIVFWALPPELFRLSPDTTNEVVVGGGEDTDDDGITAGRLRFWPLVLGKIGDSPVFGYGRHAFIRTGLSAEIVREGLEEAVGNPHSAYLELLLDTGWVGFLLVMPFYMVVMFTAVRLFRDSRSPIFIAAGGAATALVLAQLVAGVSGQSFYPREGTVGMWCAIFLAFRVDVERSRAISATRAAARLPIPENRVDPVSAVASPRFALAQHRPSSSSAGRRAEVGAIRRNDEIDRLLWARAGAPMRSSRAGP